MLDKKVGIIRYNRENFALSLKRREFLKNQELLRGRRGLKKRRQNWLF